MAAVRVVDATTAVTLLNNVVQRTAGEFWRRDLFGSTDVVEAFAATCSTNVLGCVEASGNVAGTAGFTDAAAGDFTLQPGAYCIDGGLDLAPWVDAPWRDADLYGVAYDATPHCGPAEYVP